MAVFRLDFYEIFYDTGLHMKILRRNLSLMLAVRYLNPLRTMFSIITLICLGGVALGVMILVVVLSVMEGLQKEMEEKGFALQPHYTASLSDAFTGSPRPITPQDCDWPAVAEQLRKQPNVACVYPKLEGMAFAQTDKYQNATLMYSSVQSDNEEHLKPLYGMIKAGNFNLGMENKCVISLNIAKKFGLGPGNRLTLTPVSGNIEQMANILQKIEGEMLTQTTPQFLETMRNLFADAVTTENTVTLTTEKYQQAMQLLLPFVDIPDSNRMADLCEALGKDSLTEEEITALRPVVRKLRQSEADACLELYYILKYGTEQTTDTRAQWDATVETLAALDRDKENGKEIENLRSLVVPVDLEIVGVYQTPENMPGPDLFLPLHVAQESVGYTDNNIMGICLRLKDPHSPGNIEQVMAELITQYSEAAQQQEDTADSDMPPPVEEVDYSALETEAPAETAATAEEIVVPDVAEPTEPEAEYIQPRNPTMWSITPWTDALQSLYKLIANERVMMSFVLSSITLVASFCIMAVMFTMSLQRKREIAVLQALGATPRKIVGIFAWQGVIIGFLGAVLGVLLSLLVLYYRHEIQGALAGIGMDPFPMEAHGISLPAVYRPEIFIKQAIVAFIMVTIASIIPALFVSRQDPAKALRSN